MTTKPLQSSETYVSPAWVVVPTLPRTKYFVHTWDVVNAQRLRPADAAHACSYPLDPWVGKRSRTYAERAHSHHRNSHKVPVRLSSKGWLLQSCLADVTPDLALINEMRSDQPFSPSRVSTPSGCIFPQAVQDTKLVTGLIQSSKE